MKLHIRLIIGFMDTVRPFLGLQNMVCIYPISCTDFAKDTLTSMPLYKAIPKITLRVFSCNPITVFFKKK